MIRFVTTPTHGYTVTSLDGDFGAPLPPCEALDYGSLFAAKTLPGGTYVFCDLERLSHHELVLAAAFYRAMKQADGFQVLNDPARVKTRYALLTSLQRAGINGFGVHRADGFPTPQRFPVFVRAEAVHEAALTDLIPDQSSLDAELGRLVAEGHPLRGLLVIEFRADPFLPGIYRRWGTFNLGGNIHLDHIVTEDSWNVKWGRKGLVGDDVYRSDDAALRANAHADVLAQAFEIAGIDYGRADFGLADGRPQIYEINTNPFIGRLVQHPSAIRMATMRFAHERFAAELWSLDTPSGGASFTLDPATLSPQAALALAQVARDREAAMQMAGAWLSRTSAQACVSDDAAALHAQIAAMQSSRSWRVTAPLRGATIALRRLHPATRKALRRKSAGICMLRDSIDLVPYLVGHYLRMGLDRLIFVDDGSSDGTYERLLALSRRDRRISVRRVDNAVCLQSEEMSAAANQAIAEGFYLVLPFDADEFWNLSPGEIRRLLDDPEPRVIWGQWQNFAPPRDALGLGKGTLRKIRHRVTPLADEGKEAILAFREPFLASLQRKVAFVSPTPIRLAKGQHALETGPNAVDPLVAEIFHIPLRHRGEIEKRALNYEPRRAAARGAISESWQSRMHAEIVANGRVDAVWAANSVDRDGCLDVFGEKRAAIPDHRLSQLLRAASFHMLRRFAMIVR